MSTVGITVGGRIDPEDGLATVRLAIGTGDGQTVFLQPAGAVKLGTMLQRWGEFAEQTNHHITAADEIGWLATHTDGTA